jgi:hypothetical protein
MPACSMGYHINCARALFQSARVVKLVDTTDLKSVGWVKPPYRFDSGSGHQTIADLSSDSGGKGFSKTPLGILTTVKKYVFYGQGQGAIFQQYGHADPEYHSNVPEVAQASQEDYEDSIERLGEWLQVMQEPEQFDA